MGSKIHSMAPILDPSLVVRPDDEIKYVRSGDVVALQDRGDLYTANHDGIARKYFPGIEINRGTGKPIVDDAGFVSLHQEKIYFAGRPITSCETLSNLKNARQKTKEVAVSILGAERVG